MAKENKNKLIRRENNGLGPIIWTIILGIYSASLIIPLVWAVLSSLKGTIEFTKYPFSLPQVWKFSNYIDSFKKLYVIVISGAGSRRVYLIEMFMYSLYYAGGLGFVAELSRACCAYCAAKFRHLPEMRFMHAFTVALMVITLPGSLAASINMRKFLGIYNNPLGELFLTFGFTGAHFLYFYAAFKGVSTGYMEAARIDGAGEYRIFLTIMLPLIRNTFFALFLLTFIAQWNAYNISLEYWPSYPVVAYGLFKFRSQSSPPSVPIQLAGCSLVILPTLTLFIAFRKQLIGNLSIGGIKG